MEKASHHTAATFPRPNLADTVPEEAAYPRVGEWLCDCKLLAELGIGAQGRIFLATQPMLRDRLVVLKVTPLSGTEHLNLAQLLHTHIVPLLFAHEFPDRRLRVLAMPYLGGAPLSAVLARLYAQPYLPRAGHDLLVTLDAVQGPAMYRVPTLRARLTNLSYISTVCWLGACLADALQHAHDRGLVHLDVKPENILLAADCQPFLLDFHLARAPLEVGAPSPAWFGGTPEYMPPEQLQVTAATLNAQPVPVTVDHRADIYALGVVLYELLTGKLPERDEDIAQQLRRHNKEVSTGLADIVAHCLAEKPDQRYPDAALLAEDLRRHLTRQPLRGVPNRDLRERFRKWTWRHPSFLSRAVAGALVACMLIAGMVLLGRHWQQQRARAELALLEGQKLLDSDQPEPAIRAFQDGLTVAWFPGETHLRQQLARWIQRALRVAENQQRQRLRGHLSGRLARLMDDLRFCWDTGAAPQGVLRSLEQRCVQLWEHRAILLESSPSDPNIRADLAEMVALWSDLLLHTHPVSERPNATQRALDLLTRAERDLGPQTALAQQKSALSPESDRDAPAQPRSARGAYLEGRSLLSAGKLSEAAKVLETAVTLEPDGFWPHFYQGVCAYRQKEYEQAVAAFRTCIALAPRAAPCYFNRAVALSALDRTRLALADLDRALELDPELGAAWLQRGLVHAREERLDMALGDLEQALERGADPARTHYNLALLHQRRGEQDKALEHARAALKYQPEHTGALKLLKQGQGKKSTSP